MRPQCCCFMYGVTSRAKRTRTQEVFFEGLQNCLVFDLRGASGVGVTDVGDQDANPAETVGGVSHDTANIPGGRQIGRDRQHMVLGTDPGPTPFQCGEGLFPSGRIWLRWLLLGRRPKRWPGPCPGWNLPQLRPRSFSPRSIASTLPP